MIEKFINEFLEDRNVAKEEDLNEMDFHEMYVIIESMKTDYFNELTIDERLSPRINNYNGVIFLTSKPNKLGYHHGHASVAVNPSGTTHLEANPGGPSKHHFNRLASYWNTVPYTAYKARGKAQPEHDNVARRAYAYNGYAYSATPSSGQHNCATLVNTIWKNEGGLSYKFVLTPAHLASHPGLYSIKNHQGGFGTN